MYRDLKEDSFEQLKEVAHDRVHPGQVFVFFWGAFVASGVVFAVTIFGSQSYNVTSPIWENIITISIILLVLQLIFTLLFSIPKIALSFQRIQILLVCLISLKISWEFYLIFFLIRADRALPETLDVWGLFAFIGGIAFLVISIIRSLGRARQGHFKADGKGLYNFQQSKGYVSLPIIFAASVFGGIFGRIQFDTAAGQLFEVLMFLLFAVVIQYSMAMVWPEFLLIAYGKFRYPSFIVEVTKKRKVIKKSKNETKPLSYWMIKPFSVIKSRAGLQTGVKAPFTAVVIVWIQGSIVFFVILTSLYIRNAVRGVIEVSIMEDLASYLIFGSVISLITVLLLRFFFTVVKKINLS